MPVNTSDSVQVTAVTVGGQHLAAESVQAKAQSSACIRMLVYTCCCIQVIVMTAEGHHLAAESAGARGGRAGPLPRTEGQSVEVEVAEVHSSACTQLNACQPMLLGTGGRDDRRGPPSGGGERRGGQRGPRGPFAENLTEGQSVEVEVAEVRPYGVMVQLEGARSLLHRNQMADAGDERTDPESFSVGQKLTVRHVLAS